MDNHNSKARTLWMIRISKTALHQSALDYSKRTGTDEDPLAQLPTHFASPLALPLLFVDSDLVLLPETHRLVVTWFLEQRHHALAKSEVVGHLCRIG